MQKENLEQPKIEPKKNIKVIEEINKLGVLKLDKNFHLYVHGNKNKIEALEDDRGTFLKIYYKEIS